MGAALAILVASSAWLLAVDSSGRALRARWADGQPVEAQEWLTAVAGIDPRTALAAGEQCMMSAGDQQVCGALFERALKGNSRLSGAVLAMAQLAEQRGDCAGARRLFALLRQRDSSFAVAWSEWNFLLRNGTREEISNGAMALIAKAPARFRGDYPFLMESGLEPGAIVEAMLAAEAPERALDFALYLGQREFPQAGDLLRGVIERRDGTPAREAALRFIAERVGSRRGLEQAAIVWETAVKRGLVADRRTSVKDDLMLNPNPGMKLPLLARSFDWSVVESRWGGARSDALGRGITIFIREGAPDGTPLLSKLVLLPEDAKGVRVTMRVAAAIAGGATSSPRLRSLEWRAYDATADRIVATAEATGDPQAQGAFRAKLLFPAAGSPRAVFLMLCFRTAGGAVAVDGPGVDEAAAIGEVRFEILH